MAGQRKFVASNVNLANMAYADQLPEDASDMVKPVPQTCICQRRDVPAPWDVIDAREMRRYPRTILEITYNRNCKVSDHSTRTGTKKILDFWRDTVTIEQAEEPC